MITQRMRLIFLFSIGLIISSGCIEIPDKITAGFDDQTHQVMQNAIDERGNQPDRWSTTMQDTIDELGCAGTSFSKEILAEVQSTYESALAFL